MGIKSGSGTLFSFVQLRFGYGSLCLEYLQVLKALTVLMKNVPKQMSEWLPQILPPVWSTLTTSGMQSINQYICQSINNIPVSISHQSTNIIHGSISNQDLNNFKMLFFLERICLRPEIAINPLRSLY